ncbi:MAG: hypothetical protein EOO88_38705 [Pedobacter sp.]|nr:MAG: hypothetical protein EOO88_38705 [Pedobacter sp.]
MPRPSPRLGLDIDLSDLAALDAPSAQAQDVQPDAEADAKFFDQFVADIGGDDIDETLPGALTTSDPAKEEPASASFDPGNLIDFDMFESSNPPADDDKPRKP